MIYPKKRISAKDKKRNKIAIRFLLVVICLVFIFYLVNKMINNNKKYDIKSHEDFDSSVHSPGTYETDGKLYTQDQDIKNILLVGTNDDDAEYILLVVVNRDNKTLLPIHIPRNLVCEYYELDSFGKIKDVNTGHLEKSFSNGTRDMKSLNNVKNTVEKIFCNIKIEYSMMANLKNVDEIAKEFGPVNFKAVDNYNDNGIVINKDDIVTIDSHNALALIKADDSKEDVKLIEHRQSLYVDALYNQCRENYDSDNAYFIERFANLSEHIIFSSNDILHILAEVNDYKKLDLVFLDGLYKDQDFYVDAESIESICINTIFDY